MDVTHKEHFHKSPGGTTVLISTGTLSKSAFKERETLESTGLTSFMEPCRQKAPQRYRAEKADRIQQIECGASQKNKRGR